MNVFSNHDRLVHNYNAGRILLYVTEDKPSKLLSIEGDLTEAFLLKLICTTRRNS